MSDTTARRAKAALGLTAFVSGALLVALYLWDHLTRRTTLATHWCRDRYGHPSQFDYLLPDRAERSELPSPIRGACFRLGRHVSFGT